MALSSVAEGTVPEAAAEGPWLVLFDIDGTLLSCGPQIRAIFGSALEEVYGTTGPMEGYDFAGRTDHGIVLDLMTAAGLERRRGLERIAGFGELAVGRLAARLDAAEMRLMPGVPDLLRGVNRRADVLLGLLTGNFERGARVKLGRVGLDEYFGFGAFGDGAVDRSELPPRAIELARGLARRSIARERVLVIGDSVLDVRCARDHGLRSIAVATGFTSRRELREAGAHHVLDDLLDAGRCSEVFARP